VVNSREEVVAWVKLEMFRRSGHDVVCVFNDDPNIELVKILHNSKREVVIITTPDHLKDTPIPETYQIPMIRTPIIPGLRELASAPFEDDRRSLTPDPKQFHADVERCISIIRSAKRPVKWGYVVEQLDRPEFRGLEQAVRESPSVRRRNHKGKWYYTA